MLKELRNSKSKSIEGIYLKRVAVRIRNFNQNFPLKLKIIKRIYIYLITITTREILLKS